MGYEKIVELGAIAGAVLAIIGLLAWAINTIKATIKPLQDIRDATAATLKCSITRAHKEYMREGRINRYSLHCIMEMGNAYEELGKNGFIHDLIEDLKALPMDY